MGQKIRVSVIIPAYNEEQTIADVLDRIPKQCIKLVVDDGSTDKTADISREHGAYVITHKDNKGVGNAFRTGIKTALKINSDIIVNLDADGQMYPENIIDIINPIIKKEADATIATRFKFKHIHPQIPWGKKIGNKFGSKFISFLTGKKFSDTQCGFRAYSKEAAASLTLYADYTYTQEALMDLANKGFKIKEIPLYIKGERIGESRVVKNILSYCFKVMPIIIRALRDNKPFMFFGFPGFILFLIGSITSIALFFRKIVLDGALFDHPWIIFFSMVFIIGGILLLSLALLSDMIQRHRKITEEIVSAIRENETT